MQNKNYHCVESTLDIKLSEYGRAFLIRLWVNEPANLDNVQLANYDLQHKVVLLFREWTKSGVLDIKALANQVANMQFEKQINAVQVKEFTHSHENGIMLYCVEF